jgi:hypothetical protein
MANSDNTMDPILVRLEKLPLVWKRENVIRMGMVIDRDDIGWPAGRISEDVDRDDKCGYRY